jgi:hypothetical protein
MFHSYSAGNCMLLAAQAHQRGILAPVPLKAREDQLAEDGDKRRRVVFRTAFVFDLSQTDVLEGAEPAALEPPRQPVTGDSHAHLLAPLHAFAESLGYAVWLEPIAGSAGGWCDPKGKRIVVDAQVPANAQLRTLIHECAHALGIGYDTYSRAQAEVMSTPRLWSRQRPSGSRSMVRLCPM